MSKPLKRQQLRHIFSTTCLVATNNKVTCIKFKIKKIILFLPKRCGMSNVPVNLLTSMHKS